MTIELELMERQFPFKSTLLNIEYIIVICHTPQNGCHQISDNVVMKISAGLVLVRLKGII